MNYKKLWLVLVATFLLSYTLSLVLAIVPNGAQVTPIRTETANASSPKNHTAQAGNLTELTIFGYSSTQSWQGYFGNVSGTIQLATQSGYTLYNWSLAEPEGEVYAAVNKTIFWTNVQCFNFSATGSLVGDTAGGGTSINGTNLTWLETLYNIGPTDADGVNETFLWGPHSVYPGSHDLFYTANLEFSAGECTSTRVFTNNGIGEDGKFEEVLLYDPITATPIFAALIEKPGALGFDNQTYDFEMLVLEDGHGTNVDTTTYFFFVELA